MADLTTLPLPPDCPYFPVLDRDYGQHKKGDVIFALYPWMSDPTSWSHDSDFPVTREDWEEDRWKPIICSISSLYWYRHADSMVVPWGDTEKDRERKEAYANAERWQRAAWEKE